MTNLDTISKDFENDSRREKARLEKAIVRLANARTDTEVDRFSKAFPGLAAVDAEDLRNARTALDCAWNLPGGRLRAIPLFHLLGGLIPVHAWTGFANRLDRLPIFMQAHLRELGSYVSGNGFVRLALHALECTPQMRVCQNPACPNPYYLRREGGKRFCSKQCAAPSQRSHKLAWWNDNKKKLLAERRAKRRKVKKRISRRGKSKRKGGQQG